MLAETAAESRMLRRIHAVDERKHWLDAGQKMSGSGAFRVGYEVPFTSPPNIVEAGQGEGIPLFHVMDRGFVPELLVDPVVVTVDHFV
jgi:hypothetical protein